MLKRDISRRISSKDVSRWLFSLEMQNCRPLTLFCSACTSEAIEPLVKTDHFDTPASNLSSHTGRIRNLTFSPNGRYLALITSNNIQLRDLLSGTARDIPCSLEAAQTVTFCMENMLVVYASEQQLPGHFILCHGVDKKVDYGLTTVFSGFVGSASVLVVSPDGRFLACSFLSNEFYVCELETNASRGRLGGSNGIISCFNFSADVSLLACAYTTGSMEIWDLKTMQLKYKTSTTSPFGLARDIAYPTLISRALSDADNAMRLEQKGLPAKASYKAAYDRLVLSQLYTDKPFKVISQRIVGLPMPNYALVRSSNDQVDRAMSTSRQRLQQNLQFQHPRYLHS